MDFKITKLKIIIATTVSIIVGYLMYLPNYLLDGTLQDGILEKIQASLTSLIISFMLIYCGWSLFQGKGQKWWIYLLIILGMLLFSIIIIILGELLFGL